MANAISGFRSTGIWPLDRNVFKDTDFVKPTLNIPTPASDSMEETSVQLLEETPSGVDPPSPRINSPQEIENVCLEREKNARCLKVSVKQISPLPQITSKQASKGNICPKVHKK
ncbi:hypothetical protein C0J52_12298 [Blattella germanica]|nr:hypothetical protein C0J52_12298 [Blattella germanica]